MAEIKFPKMPKMKIKMPKIPKIRPVKLTKFYKGLTDYKKVIKIKYPKI